MAQQQRLEDFVRSFKGSHKNSHLFRIDNFSLLKKYQIEECESSVFDIGGHKWKLILYPNGNEDDNGKGYISLYLEKQDSDFWRPNRHSKLEVQLFVVNQLNRGTWKTGPVIFDFSSNKWGISRLVTHRILNDSEKGFLVDDSVMFGVKLSGIQGMEFGTAECLTLVENPPDKKFTWQIKRFSFLSHLTEAKSGDFDIGNRTWRIHLYPKGCGDGEGHWLSMYLVGDGYTANTTAVKTRTYTRFKFRVIDQINRNDFEREVSHWYSVEPQYWGFTKFMPLGDLHDPTKGFLVNDLMLVGVEILVVSMTTLI